MTRAIDPTQSARRMRGDDGKCPELRSTGRRLRDDDGIAAVLVAMLTTVVLMFAALAIDGGMAYQSHRQSQNASDTGAMAGARTIEQYKFYPYCGTTVPPNTQPCTNFFVPLSIKVEILRVADQTGADTTAGGVQCWLLDSNGNPTISSEFCDAAVFPLTPANVMASSGVKVSARQTKGTSFARVSGANSTSATTSAKAFVFDFGGGTGSPFIMCGIRDTMPAGYSPAINWSYNILTANGSGGYKLVSPSPVGQYFSVQGSQNPSCGTDSATFKGKGDGQTVNGLPAWDGITTGNGFSNTVQLSVTGITPCPPGVSDFNGCGMLIPIADVGTGAGSGTQMHIVTWLAWQLWGSGSSFDFSTLTPNTTGGAAGQSCMNPITSGGSMKYCGKLLGAVTTNGGTGSGPGTAGQPHIIRLSE